MDTVMGVFVGRMCPVHLGHKAIINKMIAECGEDVSLVVIGSSNQPMSLRHFFSYEERRAMILTLFPRAQVVGLPDYPTNCEWLLALDDIIRVARGNPSETEFFGGCEEDVRFFIEAGRKVNIINRFDGSTPKVSATEVRDALIHGRSLEDLVDPAIVPAIRNIFLPKWEVFKRT